MQREEAAEDLYLKANELDYLSDMFVECVYAQRKSLRQKLVSMRVNGQSQAKPKTLLETYLQIVKTGAPQEIEQFRKFERQKLVELLSTNQELLNHIHDRMFRNMQDSKEREQAILSQLTLSETGLDPQSLQQLIDPIDLLKKSSEIRHLMHQASSPGGGNRKTLNQASVRAYKKLRAKQEALVSAFHSQTKTSGLTMPMSEIQESQQQQLERRYKSMAIAV